MNFFQWFGGSKENKYSVFQNGPVNHSHGRIREAYLNIKKGQKIDENVKSIFDDVCGENSSLRKREDGVPEELQMICPIVSTYFSALDQRKN